MVQVHIQSILVYSDEPVRDARAMRLNSESEQMENQINKLNHLRS